ncbi:hypothetical protein EGJ28_22010 [Stutzerimonas xanthomarina]|jgi:hypothetical protein|uniref:Uncharacterized protein n=2 Tax=Stutzerimonas TaxID=2901164 RepID=A0AA40RVD2_STUST|nr:MULTISPECIES: hypothetical protein [Stutzerimonas]KIL03059.1 hypothetical protein QX25_17725 [Stutzerimonas stutzeri]MBA1306711.1 hypothetical protein [Stutzerimonas stutzeri]MBK3919818.1 hypothetical protein [Stutzerimonas frequens]RRV04695.1 hypothetical protein EGJ28_22010 [Stutzerimonas xanthomarina]
MRKTSSSLAVSKLAQYAEDPAGFIKADGKAYNQKAAAAGTKAHQRIGAGPSKAKFLLATALVLAALIYFGVIEV